MSYAEQSLRELLVEVAEKENYGNHKIEVIPFTSSGANYTSAIFYATIRATGKDDLNLFAKVAIMNDKSRDEMQMDSLFKIEQLFYNKLVNDFQKIEKKYEIPYEEKFQFPKFYAGREERGQETVVLENLAIQGYGMYSRFESVDWEYAAKSIELLAYFHALSFAFQKEDPEEYERIIKILQYSLPEQTEETDKMFEALATTALKVLSEDNQAKVVNFLQNCNPSETYQQFVSTKRRPIITHGDFRPSNLLSKKLENNSYNIVLVDYQTLRSANPVSDLIYFVILGTDEKFRAEYFDQLVEHYYEHLTLALKRFQIDITEVYPREEFDDDLKKLLPCALILCIVVLKIVLVEADSAPKLNEGMQSLLFEDKNDLYADRFTGIVNDCCKWGIL